MEVKQKGKKALNKVSEFLGMKEKLQEFRKNVQESIAEVDKAIEKIDALGTGMLGYADAAIEKVEKLSADVKQYQSKRADQEVERMAGEEVVDLAVLSMVAEKEYQYGAEAFEAEQQMNERNIKSHILDCFQKKR